MQTRQRRPLTYEEQLANAKANDRYLWNLAQARRYKREKLRSN